MAANADTFSQAYKSLAKVAEGYGFDGVRDAAEFIRHLANNPEQSALLEMINAEQVETDVTDEVEVTPWKVVGQVDNAHLLDKLVRKFGCDPISDELIARIERVTGKEAHMWLKRGIVFAHRDLEAILDDYESGKPFYLYTGRGPTSASLHLGHLISYIFTAEFAKLFDVPVVIQIADDEKVSFRGIDWDEMRDLTMENVKDLIACGFDPEKTYIFSNRDRSSNEHYKMVYRDIANMVNLVTIKKVFGLTRTDNIGMYDWTVWQSVPAFSQAFADIFDGKDMRCLVIYGLDQDPYFRVARDYAAKAGLHKPAGLICTFLPPLTGDGKMSSSDKEAPTLFVTLTEKKIRKLVNKHCFSGGKELREEQLAEGADLNVDMSVKYLDFFMEDSDEISHIKHLYGSGELADGEERMLTGEVKSIMAGEVVRVITSHQEARAAVDEEVIAIYFTERTIV